MSRPVRVANCSGFYGDRRSAALEMVRGGPIDVLTGDWLAELTMGILARDQLRDPGAGFAKTFVPMLEPALPTIADEGIRVVSNAGGLNPRALAAALRERIAALGLSLRVATVAGDDLREPLLDWLRAGRAFPHLATGEAYSASRGAILTANAYLGCWPIARALEAGADIVITGRVTDAAVVMGAAAWWHGWAPDDHDALAGALAAGHVIECGCQATGGNQPFWEELNLRKVGFPIASIDADGSAEIHKHPGTGGAVDRHSVTAQLLYEVGAPAYVSPDVVAHLDTAQLQDLGGDRVRLQGVRGSPPPPTLKLGLVLAAGYRNRMTAVIGGRDGEAKARLLEELAWEGLGGRNTFDEARADVYRRADAPPTVPADDLTLVDFSVRDRDPKKVGTRFTAPLVELALATIPGLTFASPPAPPSPVAVFWPTRIDRDLVRMGYALDGGPLVPVPHPPRTSHDLPADAVASPPPYGPVRGQPEPLGLRVGARSGDKGGDANVGFWVRDPADHAWMSALLTTERLRAWLAPSGFVGSIERYDLPNLYAVNFVLRGWLGDGVAANLAPDPQAKCLGEFFRAQTVPGPTPD